MKLSTAFMALVFTVLVSACSSTKTKQDEEASQRYIERMHFRADRH